jgi:hypothetical protein
MIFLTLTRSTWLGLAQHLTTQQPGRRYRLWLRPGRVWLATWRRQVAAGVVAVIIAGAIASLPLHRSRRALLALPALLGTRADALGAGRRWCRLRSGTGGGIPPALSRIQSAGRVHAIHSHNGFRRRRRHGIPGVLATLVLIRALSWPGARLRRAEGHARFSIAGSAGAFVAVAVFSQPTLRTRLGPLAALAVVGAVAVLSIEASPAPIAMPAPLTSPHAVGARRAASGAHGLLITWGRLDVAHYEYSNSLHNANAHRWPAAAGQARRAVELDPSFAIYRFQYGSVLARDYMQSGNALVLDDAVAQLKRGLALEPRSAIGHANLALLYADPASAAKRVTKPRLLYEQRTAAAAPRVESATGGDRRAARLLPACSLRSLGAASPRAFDRSSAAHDHLQPSRFGSPTTVRQLTRSRQARRWQRVERVNASPADLADKVTLAGRSSKRFARRSVRAAKTSNRSRA